MVLGSAVLSPDGSVLAAYAGSRIYLWNGVTGVQQTEIYKVTEDREEAPISIAELAFSPDGHWLASGGDQIRLWDVSFNSIQTLQAEFATRLEPGAWHVAFSADGRLLAASSELQTEIWDVTERKLIATVEGGQAQFLPDDRIISLSAAAVSIWDAEGKLLTELSGEKWGAK